MIKLFVEGREIALPSDISFEFTSENRLFSNADGYSFDIEIPLKESAVNSEVFGIVWRMDADLDTLKFSAMLVTPQVTMQGIVAIVSVNESTLSIQFLEGRSVQNFEKDLEEIYVNEIEIVPFDVPLASAPPAQHWMSYDQGAEAVAIPWVNANSGIVQNNVVKENGIWKWDPDNRGLSYMPYITVLIHRICDKIGYSCNIRSLEESRFRHLLVCNALPAALAVSDYTAALPHWTVNEFFENLEIILRGEFEIDNVAKSVSFRFTEDILAGIAPVDVDMVVDEFSADIDTMNDDKSDLDLLKNISFKDNGSRFWKIHSCDWFVNLRKKNPNSSSGWIMPGSGYIVGDDGHRYPEGERIYKCLVEFDSMEEFVSKFKAYEFFGFHRNDIVQRNLYYIREFDAYFIFHSTDYVEIPGKGWFHHYELIQVNVFGDYIVDPDDDDSVEIQTVPVPVDMAEFNCAFLYFSNSDDSSVSGDEVLNFGTDKDLWDGSGNPTQEWIDIQKAVQPLVYQSIEAGESSKSEYFDKLYLGFWPGYQPFHEVIGLCPVTSNVVVYDYFKYMPFPDFSLRLNHGFARGVEGYLSVDPKKLYKFSFLSDSLPSPRATFFIKGKRYVCSKLTASFSQNGMSRLIKGEFYRF